MVQIYVDDIIFGSINPKIARNFSELMKNRFEKSIVGEISNFLGLHVHQSSRDIFINQLKYAFEILKKHGMEGCDLIGTPMREHTKLDADKLGKLVDATKNTKV